MDRAAVAAFYRAKGYTVHESMVATGHSGNGHRVPLLCEGPLGNLAVFFGDEGGIDGPEMGGARRVAKDLGATPVLAAPTFTNTQRNQAAELGVVLLDADAVMPETTIPNIPVNARRPWPEAALAAGKRDDPFAAHPWPNSGRPGGRDGNEAGAVDVDDLLAELDGRSRPTPRVAAQLATTAPVAAPAPPHSTATPTEGDGLWRRPRGATTATLAPASAPAVAPRQPNATRFAWLGVAQAPTPTPIEVDLEHTDVVQARTPRAAPVATPEHAYDQTALDDAAVLAQAWRRKAETRRWLRRAAWIGGSALAVWLFALWWF